MAILRLKHPIITVVVFAHKFTFFWCENISELFHDVSSIITLKISKGITFIISFKEAVGIIFMNGTTNYSTLGSLITTKNTLYIYSIPQFLDARASLRLGMSVSK